MQMEPIRTSELPWRLLLTGPGVILPVNHYVHSDGRVDALPPSLSPAVIGDISSPSRCAALQTILPPFHPIMMNSLADDHPTKESFSIAARGITTSSQSELASAIALRVLLALTHVACPFATIGGAKLLIWDSPDVTHVPLVVRALLGRDYPSYGEIAGPGIFWREDLLESQSLITQSLGEHVSLETLKTLNQRTHEVAQFLGLPMIDVGPLGGVVVSLTSRNGRVEFDVQYRNGSVACVSTEAGERGC